MGSIARREAACGGVATARAAPAPLTPTDDPSLADLTEGNKMSTVNMVLLLLAVVLSVFVGFAWMAYCFR